MFANNSDAPEAGKGRATRSRKEAEAARKNTLKVPTDRKAARKAMQARAMEERVRIRRAMYSGDDKHLPLRDQGPVKRFVRDWVDSRVSAGELFVPVAFLIVAMMAVPSKAIQTFVSLVWFVMFVVLIFDSIYIAFAIRRKVIAKFDEAAGRGVAVYALMRSIGVRWLRLPKPMVKVGGAPRTVKIPKSLL